MAPEPFSENNPSMEYELGIRDLILSELLPSSLAPDSRTMHDARAAVVQAAVDVVIGQTTTYPDDSSYGVASVVYAEAFSMLSTNPEVAGEIHNVYFQPDEGSGA